MIAQKILYANRGTMVAAIRFSSVSLRVFPKPQPEGQTKNLEIFGRSTPAVRTRVWVIRIGRGLIRSFQPRSQ